MTFLRRLALTLHEQPQEAAVVVGKLVPKEARPVLAENRKRHHNLFLGFKAAGLEGQVDGLQEPGPFGQWGPRTLQPLMEIKLKEEK